MKSLLIYQSKSLLSSRLSCSLSLTLEKSDLSSVKILHVETIPLGPSLIYINNRSGSKTEPLRKPARIFTHKEVCPFKTTFCLRSFEQFSNNSNRLPPIL